MRRTITENRSGRPFNRDRFRRRTRATALALALLAPASLAQAATAQLWVQAPFDVKTGNFDLDDLGEVNTPLFSANLEIPYATIEPLIRNQIKAVVDQTISGVAVCTNPCPDVTYSVGVTADFDFTQTGQPTLSSVGNASANGVAFDLDTQAKLRLDVHVTADSALTFPANIDLPIEVWVGIHANGTINLWPTVAHQGLNVSLTLDASNVDVVGLNGSLVAIGAELGALLNLSPLSLAFGGPLLIALGAMLGDAGANLAEQAIEAFVTQRLDVELQNASQLIEGQLDALLGSAIVQVNAAKDTLMDTPLPGVNKSLTQLQNDLGMTLDVRTSVVANNLRSVATTRMAATPGSGVLKGKLRLPKTKCQYMTVGSHLLGHWQKAFGTTAANEDLAAMVGQPCSTVFAAGDMDRQLYLGESPEKRLQSGSSSNVLPSWASIGTTTYPGNLASFAGYYECQFQVTNLPNAAIVDLEPKHGISKRLSGKSTDDRFLALTGRAGTAVFNSEINPVSALNGVVWGGFGPADVGDCESSGGGGGGGLHHVAGDLMYQFDPEICPQCEVRVVDLGSEVIYEVTNVEAFLRTPLGQEIQIRAAANQR